MIPLHTRRSTLEYCVIFRVHSPGLISFIQLTPLAAHRQMGWENLSSSSEFFLLGLSEQPEQQEVLFGLFLSMYLITVAGNLLIILAIVTDAQLHTPMYFFLANLSLADACFVSTTVPKMLANIWIQNQAISYAGCLSQLYFFMLFVMLEAFLLAVMAYDRYVAICHPLHYIMVMSPGLCVLLVSASWTVNALHSLLHTLLMNRLSFCADHEIPHFFCDINPLLSLSCTDPFINELVIFTIGGLAGLVCVLCLIISYAYIFSTILKIPSAQGKRKAFSTCSSHLSVVSLFFGTSFCVYFSPPSTRSAQKGTVASVMYTVVTPMLNPFIYSLRNRDIKSSLRKLIWVRKIHSAQRY
nr:PREDICTED: olfactory receptor 1G1 [Rhinolophus sinicus]